MSRCIGCGIKIQTDNPEKPGYLPEIIAIENGEEVYCKRCHDIKHHNEQYFYNTSESEYYQKIAFIKDTKSLVLLLIDVLNIESSFIENLPNYIGNNKVIILINKIDVLPASVKLNKIEMFVKNLALKEKLNVVSVMQISAYKRKNLDKVLEKIKKLKYKKIPKERKPLVLFDDCYVLGSASVGKSTFINSLMAITGSKDKARLTTSDQFQTTQDLIKIPLDQKSFIIDTPGIINKNSYGAYLSYDSMRVITPKKYLKPKTYQLMEAQTIFLGGLVRMDFLNGENISVTCYVSNDLYIHRTKMTNADELERKQYGKLLTPPCTEEEFEKLAEKKTITYKYDNEFMDLEIAGLGFVHLTGKNVKVSVTVAKQINIKMVNTFL